jgi:PAS domain S-box-containing protein
MRSTGLDVIGDVPWGTHFCQFYQDRDDLVDLLVPYFKAGLDHNEFCMWVTSEPLRVEDAAAAMRGAVPGFDDCLQRGQIRILDYREWYTLGGSFDADRVLRAWVDEAARARARGLDGLRLSSNTDWLDQSDWHDFTQYEAAVDAAIHEHPMLALCTYSLARCGAGEIMDVMSNHAFALIKRGGRWQVIESNERRKIEASLRVTEQRYRSLFNGMTEGFALHEIVCDAEGRPCDYRFLDINPAFERLTGLRREGVVGRLMTEVLPHDDPRWVRMYGHVALTGEPVHFDNYSPELRRHYDVFAYRPAPGQFAVVFLDISDLKMAEVKLAEANRLKDEFLANLSHELRTPLNAIIGWADLLSGKQLDAATTEHAVEVISRNAKAQAQLVSDVLDVSRITAGKMRLNVQQVDLPAVVQSAMDVVRPAAEAKKVTLQATIHGASAPVTGDPDRLQQVLWNLLSNSVKFTPQGGNVDVALRRAGATVELIVRDTGAGIDPGVLPYVFERFRQGDASSSRQHGGLGLGLAITRHLVELHGGTVHAESAGEGAGAAFAVRLPVRAVIHDAAPDTSAPPARPADSAVGRLPDGSLSGVSVLVVDDEEDARELIRAVLARQGAEIRLAASAAEALAAVASRAPDVLLADIGMPGCDGYELIRRVRIDPDPARASMPAIAFTAYGREDDRRRALRAGFDRHEPKPILPDALVALVASVAGRAGR